jgi:hypothetical protein
MANPSDEVHRSVLDVLVAYAAPRCQTLAELLDYLPGAYPGDVIKKRPPERDQWNHG